jgi:hypothetical protein
MIFNLTNNIQLTLPTQIVSIEYGLITLTFIVLCVTLFSAYKRLKSSVRFSVVALLNILSFCALISLSSDIKIKKDAEFSSVLLTYGTSQQQIDSIPMNENTQVFILSSIPNWSNALNLIELPDHHIIDNTSDIFLIQPNLTKLAVYGDGLASQQWQMLNTFISSKKQRDVNKQGVEVDFFASPIRTGPVKLEWPKQLVFGQPFTIKGLLQVESADEQRIFNISLFDMYDERVDEFLIKNNEKFNLSAAIKSAGLFTYQLKVFDDEQSLILSEPVSFTVTSSEKINVVIKQSSASFESKHLKNWLAEQGEEVLVLTQVSKNKFIQQIVNSTDESKIANKSDYQQMLTATWLKNVDLLYMDGRAVLSLSDREVNALGVAIKQGLGFIIIVDDELLSVSNENSNNSLESNSLKNNKLLSTLFPQGSLPIDTVNEQILTTVPRWLHGQEEINLTYKHARLPATQGKVIITGSEGQPLLVTHNYGLGKAALSLIHKSYQWVTSDEISHYSQYWQYIIEQIARQKHYSGWQSSLNNKIYFPGQTQSICAQLNDNDVRNITVENISLLPSVVIDSAYCGVYIGNDFGWHNFSITNNKTDVNQGNASNLLHDKNHLNTLSIFVYAQQNWLSWQQLLKHEASNAAHEKSSQTVGEINYTPIEKLKFWWLLFLASSLLWYERKIF